MKAGDAELIIATRRSLKQAREDLENLRERGERDENEVIDPNTTDAATALGGVDETTYKAWKTALTLLERNRALLRQLVEVRAGLLDVIAPITWAAPYRELVRDKTQEKKREKNKVKQARHRAGAAAGIDPKVRALEYGLRRTTEQLDRVAGYRAGGVRHGGRRRDHHADRVHAILFRYFRGLGCIDRDATKIIWELLRVFGLTKARNARTLARRRAAAIGRHPSR
jgi:hypothetical protein